MVLAWVPGTSGVLYGFGHGQRRRSVELAGFFISTTPGPKMSVVEKLRSRKYGLMRK